MDLPEYLKRIGDDVAALKFGVSERRIASWRLRQRLPRPAMARHIAKVTEGVVTLADIYAPPPVDDQRKAG